jgi:hypothetical protein
MSDLSTRIKVFLESKAAEGSARDLKKEMANLNREIDKAPIGSQRYTEALKKWQEGNAILQEHRNKMKGVEGGLSSLATKLGPLAAATGIAFTADAIIGYGNQLFTTATQMEALGKKAATVFGDQLPKVTQAAQDNAAAMGLTNAEYLRAAANIQDLLVPMGFQRDEAANISTSLVNLSGALSEWTGGQKSATEVSEILNKALLGEREELKSLGISISEADVKNRLAAKGLSDLTGQTLDQANAAATLELITEKSTDAQTAFTQGAGSLQRQQAEMSARFNTITEQLSTALIPVFNRLLQAALPVVEGIADFVEVLTDTDTAAKSTSPTMQLMGQIFGQVGSVIGFVFDVTKAFAGFLFKSFAPAIKVVGTGLFTLVNGLGYAANEVAQLIGSEVRFQPIDTELFRRSIDEVVAKINEGDKAVSGSKVFAEGEQKTTQTTRNPPATKSASGKAKKKAKPPKLTEEQKTELKNQKELERRRELAKIYRRNLQDDEIADIEAFEVERDALLAAQRAQDALDAEALRIERGELEADARAQVIAETLDVYDSERSALNTHFLYLISLANQYGIDTTALRKKWAEEATKIDQAEAQKRTEVIVKELEAKAQLFGELGNLVTEFGNIVGAEGEEFAAFKKVLTLAQIAFDTAAAISSLTASSSANPSNSVTFGAAGALQFTTGLVRILANIAQARKILTAAPVVKQKYMGGFDDYIGATDGRSYSAKFIGRPGTGMLNYNHPVVLANERGPEYYVDHDTLRNPVALRYVQAIENLKHGRTTQMYEGGFTGTPSANATTAAMPGMEALTSSVIMLNNILSSGRIFATISDSHLREVFERYDKLVRAQG